MSNTDLDLLARHVHEAKNAWFGGVDNGEPEFYREKAPGHVQLYTISEIKAHRDKLIGIKDPKQERSVLEWDGKGLPPVGAVCEYSDAGREHIGVLVMGYYDKSIWLRTTKSGENGSPFTIYNDNDPSVFRPIRTERDKCIEAMVGVMQQKGGPKTDITQAEALYDSNLFDISLREEE